MRALAGLVACLALAASNAHAQCREFSAGLAAPAPYSSGFVPFTSGGVEYAYGIQTHPPLFTSSVVRWTGTTLEPVFTLDVSGRRLRLLVSADLGTGRRLYATHAKVSGVIDTGVWQFDGASCSQLGASIPGQIRDLVAHDDGTGPALYVSTATASATGIVYRWDGAAWTQVGATLARPVGKLASFDDGGGSRLYVGSIASAPIVASSTVASWDGNAWSAVGTLDRWVTDLHVHLGALYAGIDASSGSAGVVRLASGAWTPLAGVQVRQVRDLATIDFGQGPELAIGGEWSPGVPGLEFYSEPGGVPTVVTPAGLSVFAAYLLEPFASTTGQKLAIGGAFSEANGLVTSNFAFFDGTNWSTIGRGFDNSLFALGVHDFGAGPQLVAGSANATSGYGAHDGPQRWDGASWSLVGPALSANSMRAVRSLDLGAGPVLCVAGGSIGGSSSAGVKYWTGSGWAGWVNAPGGDVECLAAFDSGNGPELVAGGNFVQSGNVSGNRIARVVAGEWKALGSGMNDIVAALTVHDEGAGARLFAGGAFTMAGGVTTGPIARWDGTTWSALGAGLANGGVNAICTFGGDLYAGGTFTLADGAPVSHIARWNGSAWSDVPGGGSDGAVLALHVHDDGRGPALYVGGGFVTIGGITARRLARFDGSTWEEVDGGTDDVVTALESVDDDGDGDAELFVAGLFAQAGDVASGHIARLEGCAHYASFCFGDGTLVDHTTPCPCGNDGAPGRGCANSTNANGALLAASGSTQANDVVLAASGMPTAAFGIYLQHTTADDRVFHDGVLCAGGTLTRLRGRASVAGASQFPDATFAQDATLTLSQRGGVTPGSGVTRYYSTFYRNAASTFCPPATANATNGVRVVW